MADAISSWSASHPLSTWVLGVVLSGLIAAWITLAWPTIRKFCALPPQRLSLWILKARIVGVESRISVTASIRKDLRVLALSCFWTLFRWGFALAALCTANTYFAVVTLGKAAHVADTHQIFFLETAAWVLWILSIIFGVLAMISARQIFDAFAAPNETIAKLTARIERLNEKLRSKTAH